MGRTKCNLCTLQGLILLYDGHPIILQREARDRFPEGTGIYVVDADRKQRFVAWLAEIPERCVCHEGEG